MPVRPHPVEERALSLEREKAKAEAQLGTLLPLTIITAALWWTVLHWSQRPKPRPEFERGLAFTATVICAFNLVVILAICYAYTLGWPASVRLLGIP